MQTNPSYGSRMAEKTFERLTLAAAAKLIDPSGEAVSARTLYNAARSGFLTTHRIGKNLMVSREELADYLGARTSCRVPTKDTNSDSTRLVDIKTVNGPSFGMSAAPNGSTPPASPIAQQLKKLKPREQRFKLLGAGHPGRYHRSV